MAEKDRCFVVMPFGVKPKNDGSGGMYDFDKVYRVLIQRAIRNVDMIALRADETEGSRVIHADMFKDLRDRPIVLVDLSLLNANVFYELGIRHVMSPTGTVLIANEETVKKLPFDIALSRVIPYRYDGSHLDWDEVERVVPLLQAAIEEARRGSPDSPVYAFLDQVISPHAQKKEEELSIDDGEEAYSELDDYQKQFAQIWINQGELTEEKLKKLIEDHNNSSFGVRALGYYGIMCKHEQDILLKLAELLLNHEQYDLATKLFEKAGKMAELTFAHTLNLASAISYAMPNLHGADKALKLIEKARSGAKKRVDDTPREQQEEYKQALRDYSFATQNSANMLTWRWSLTRDELDLEKAISEIRDAIQLIENLLEKDIPVPLGRYALNLLKYAMFLRIAENDRDRFDVEKNFQKILALKPGRDEPYVSTSYLRWFQIFVLADMGKFDDAQKRAMSAITDDLKFSNSEDSSEVGRRQYSELRRILEQFSRYWRDTQSIARVSQVLNSAHR
ncbi:MAG TPA: hypothetical protein VLA72_16345 [Anaerolineales bacterium]|nr:hypothetical protein [Anaerolineales bacterium]